jgi:hypothetical protein
LLINRQLSRNPGVHVADQAAHVGVAQHLQGRHGDAATMDPLLLRW